RWTERSEHALAAGGVDLIATGDDAPCNEAVAALLDREPAVVGGDVGVAFAHRHQLRLAAVGLGVEVGDQHRQLAVADRLRQTVLDVAAEAFEPGPHPWNESDRAMNDTDSLPL